MMRLRQIGYQYKNNEHKFYCNHLTKELGLPLIKDFEILFYYYCYRTFYSCKICSFYKTCLGCKDPITKYDYLLFENADVKYCRGCILKSLNDTIYQCDSCGYRTEC